MANEALQEINRTLSGISEKLFGAKVAIQVVDPRELVLLKKNAHYMTKPVFDQLTANVGQDGYVASTVLCHTLASGKLEVLSGNHRVESAREAGLAEMLAFVIPHELAPNDKIAVQLSHNSLVGQDDKQILAELWAEISSLNAKMYSGLDSKLIEELEKINFSAFNAEQVKTEKVVLWLLPEEADDIEQLLDEIAGDLSSDRIWMGPLTKYKSLFDSLVKAKKLNNIKNTAVALMWLVGRFKESIEDATVAVAAAREIEA